MPREFDPETVWCVEHQAHHTACSAQTNDKCLTGECSHSEHQTGTSIQ